ncbi:MAG: ParB/RepB/Spo0J family partition protein [Candidatus Doudnabacteria bacterium]|nr:ParB/RepB/Spo0J family partition protein [Candidatus Doudnabacteria bacterium]
MEENQYQTIVNPPAEDDSHLNVASLAQAVEPDQVRVVEEIKPQTTSQPTEESPVIEAVKEVAPPENLPALSLAEISIDLIKPNPWQPRKVFNEETLQELSNSIKEHGILQPLVVVPLPDGTYQLIVGERRLRASKLAGFTKVPVVIRDYMEEQHKLEVALIENIQRHNLDPIEEALAYKQLIDQYKMTQEEVAKKVGKGRTTVTNMLRLLHLPLKIQNALAEGKITEGHARSILALPGMEKQIALYELIVSQAMTVRQVEDKVREMLERPKQVKAPRGPLDPEAAAIENDLRSKLGTKVSVKKSGESGKITIEFFSQEELNSFMEKIHRLEQ